MGAPAPAPPPKYHRNPNPPRASRPDFSSEFRFDIPPQNPPSGPRGGVPNNLEMPIEVAEAARYLPERIVAAWQIKLVLGELVQEDFKIFYADHDSIMSYISENSNCE